MPANPNDTVDASMNMDMTIMSMNRTGPFGTLKNTTPRGTKNAKKYNADPSGVNEDASFHYGNGGMTTEENEE